jgi:Protein of unknown function DUF45
MDRALPFDLPKGAPPVDVRTSARRRKTSSAQWVNGRIVVSLPAHLKGKERDETVTWLVGRLMAKRHGVRSLGDDALMERAVTLGDRYLRGIRPASVRWVTNQQARWGSCSWHSKEIRLSHRLRDVPEWVIDAVLVHEMAHLVHPNHSPDFHRLANQFPHHAEASLFLAGYGLGLDLRSTAPCGADDGRSDGLGRQQAPQPAQAVGGTAQGEFDLTGQ